MKIKILGTRGEIEASLPRHSKHSGVLIDNALLMDLGEREFLQTKPKWIFTTHLHPDHAIFVQEPIKTNIPIYAPEKYQNGIKVKVLKKEIGVGPYKIKPIPTHHSIKVKSVAYLIKKGKYKILYTGDMIWINKKYHHLFKDLNLVITEGSFMRKGGMVRRSKKTGQIYGHTGIPNLIKLFKNYTDHILFMHFGSWFYKDIQKTKEKIKKLAKENNITLRIGYDGLSIDLDKL